MSQHKNYRFEVSHYGDGRYDAPFTEVSRAVTIDEDAPWPKVLYEFAMFLSGVYGYDIAKQIILRNDYLNTEHMLTTVVFDFNGHAFPVDQFEEDDEDC